MVLKVCASIKQLWSIAESEQEFHFHSINNLRGITKAQMKIVIEIEGSKKSAYDAIVTFIYHFNS